MVAHAFSPSGGRGGWISEINVSLVYIVSRPAVIKGRLSLKQNKTKQKLTKMDESQ